MLVELDVELLVQRPSVEAGDLAIDLVHQRRGHAVVDDRVEADLGQRIAQLGRSMVERPGLVRELGSEIDNRDRASIGHGFGRHAVTSPTAAIVLSPFSREPSGLRASAPPSSSRRSGGNSPLSFSII